MYKDKKKNPSCLECLKKTERRTFGSKKKLTVVSKHNLHHQTKTQNNFCFNVNLQRMRRLTQKTFPTVVSEFLM